jgi:uncharacterized protein
METLSITKNEKNYASLTHLSAFSKFLIPLGNYILPIILWSTKKRESSFVDFHGKQILNFQLSVLLYTILLGIIAIPAIVGTFLSNFTWNELESGNLVLENMEINNLIGLGVFGFICCALIVILKIVEFFYIIYGSIKASEGEYYKYPMTINFLK